jgi:hypothetical protein
LHYLVAAEIYQLRGNEDAWLYIVAVPCSGSVVNMASSSHEGILCCFFWLPNDTCGKLVLGSRNGRDKSVEEILLPTLNVARLLLRYTRCIRLPSIS